MREGARQRSAGVVLSSTKRPRCERCVCVLLSLAASLHHYGLSSTSRIMTGTLVGGTIPTSVTTTVMY